MGKKTHYADVVKWVSSIFAVILAACALYVSRDNNVTNTVWALAPSCIAIFLALVTKEVYSSLFAGIVVGALLYTEVHLGQALQFVFEDCILHSVCDSDNMALLIWPVFLGTIVYLLGKSNASETFGKWTKKRVRTAVGAQICTIVLGILIFIDDYFNCMTVGSVMRPITDENHVSREKLAYIIDSTAAPICIIAPISSWAAAVAGFVPGEDGFLLFVQTIPYNFYALLTIVFLLVLVLLEADYGPMKKTMCCNDAENNGAKDRKIGAGEMNSGKTKATDLVIPVIATICFCVLGMLYTGDYFVGKGITVQSALANCNASFGLLLGSFCGMAFTMIYFVYRRILHFRECMEALPEGLKLMSSAVFVLVLAWGLNSVTGKLGAAEYVSGIVKMLPEEMLSTMPAIVYVIAIFLSFSTGTSWGTFGVLIPIVVYALSFDQQLMLIGISACLAGSVCGDHCSPISDTTIMASAGSQCNHIDHVTTQLPYVFTVAVISFISFLIAGFCRNWYISLAAGVIMVVGFLTAVKRLGMNK